MEKQVSVLLPVYNQVEYIEQSMRSVIAQSNFDTVLLVIADDHSTDGTWEKVNQVVSTLTPKQAEQVSVMRNPKNLGWVGNHNYLMSLVHTPYFTILNSDDFLDIDYVEKLLNVLKAEPILDGVLCGKKVLTSKVKSKKNFPNTPIGRLRHINMGEFLVRTSFIRGKNIRLPEIFTGADCIFNEKLVQQGKVKAISYYGYNNRYRMDSASDLESRSPDKYLSGSLEMFELFAQNDKWRDNYSKYTITCFIITSYLLRVAKTIDFQKFSEFLNEFQLLFQVNYQTLPKNFVWSGIRAHCKTGIFMAVFAILSKLNARSLLFAWFKFAAHYL
jgi:GT2 family glycosyltransferase